MEKTKTEKQPFESLNFIIYNNRKIKNTTVNVPILWSGLQAASIWMQTMIFDDLLALQNPKFSSLAVKS